MTLLPHHDGSPLHVSTLTPSLGESVRVRLRIPEGFAPVDDVVVLSHPDHEPRWTSASLLGTADGWSWWEAALTIENPRYGYRWLLRFSDGSHAWLNQEGLHRDEVPDAHDFVIIAHPAPPAWMTDTVIYQIFPDRFARSATADARETPDWAIPAAWDEPVNGVSPARSQQFYGGDLDGVTEHLDHLVDLGVTLIYLTPFFPAASNHRYDASNFTAVDPLLGGDDALIRLVTAAHERGLKVIGDLTANHSGDRHEWFRAAYGTPEAPESAFYYFLNDTNTEYVGWLGTPTLPKLDWSSQELRDRFIRGRGSVVARWLAAPFHLDGWRIDVANMTGRLGDVDLNEEVRRTLRETMIDVSEDTILLAETTNDIASDFQGDAWHGAMTYPSFTRPLWSWLSRPDGAEYLLADGSPTTVPWFFGQPLRGIPRGTGRQFVDAVTRFTASIPWRVRLGNMLALDTHDTARLATHVPDELIPLAVGLSVTLPGIPTLFAGDEFGLTGIDGELSRTPMPWDSLGADATDRFALYRELIALRHAHPVLGDGGLRWLHADEDTVVFVREGSSESILVLASTSAAMVRIESRALAGEARASLLTGSAELRQDGDASELTSAGATLTLWSLPGVATP